MTTLELARQLDFIRELPNNAGQRVEAIQKWGGGKKGDAWCAYWLTMVLDIIYKGKCPLQRTGSCDVILEQAYSHNWVVDDPKPGDIYLLLNNSNDAHHVGFVTSSPAGGKFGQISGNTSKGGTSSNGDGVYETIRSLPPKGKILFVRLP